MAGGEALNELRRPASELASRRPHSGASQQSAIGRTIEPVAPRIESGRQTKVNSYRPSRASSSQLTISMMKIPRCTSSAIWTGCGLPGTVDGRTSCASVSPATATTPCSASHSAASRSIPACSWAAMNSASGQPERYPVRTSATSPGRSSRRLRLEDLLELVGTSVLPTRLGNRAQACAAATDSSGRRPRSWYAYSQASVLIAVEVWICVVVGGAAS
jgi:hypothetical protein